MSILRKIEVIFDYLAITAGIMFLILGVIDVAKHSNDPVPPNYSAADALAGIIFLLWITWGWLVRILVFIKEDKRYILAATSFLHLIALAGLFLWHNPASASEGPPDRLATIIVFCILWWIGDDFRHILIGFYSFLAKK